MALIARTPQEVGQLFGQRLKAGDIDGAMELYDEAASFAVDADTVVRGPDRIREAVVRFAALSPDMSGDIVWVQEAGDSALIVNRWHLSGTDEEGNPVEMSGQAADVLRRGTDGGWRFLIDCPVLGSLQ